MNCRFCDRQISGPTEIQSSNKLHFSETATLPSQTNFRKIHQHPHRTARGESPLENGIHRGSPVDKACYRHCLILKERDSRKIKKVYVLEKTMLLTLLLPTVANTSGSPSLLCQLNCTPNSGWPWSSWQKERVKKECLDSHFRFTN